MSKTSWTVIRFEGTNVKMGTTMILCQEHPYIKELAHFIHLNTLMTGLVEDMKKLDKHPWCSHRVLMNKTKQPWQNVDYVYGLVSGQERLARKRDSPGQTA